MFGRIENVAIKGIHATLPHKRIDNMDFKSIFGESAVKKQIKVTGMRYRYEIDKEQTAIDLGYNSADILLRESGWNRNEIDYIVYVSVGKEYALPARAYELINRLHIGEQCRGFDINLGCTAYVSGLHTIASLISNKGKGAKGILISTDASSMYTDEEDKATSMLQSDCGSATLLEWDAAAEPIVFDNHSKGECYDKICQKNETELLHMDGLAVFEFAISDVANSIKLFLNTNNAEIDFSILHQAQKFIVDKVVAFSGLNKEKNLIVYDKYANAGCASIPLTLCENRELIMKNNAVNRFFFCGFGSGLAWESMMLSFQSAVVMPINFI